MTPAIATETGCFRFSSTTSATYGATAELLDAGVNPDVILNMTQPIAGTKFAVILIEQMARGFQLSFRNR